MAKTIYIHILSTNVKFRGGPFNLEGEDEPWFWKKKTYLPLLEELKKKNWNPARTPSAHRGRDMGHTWGDYITTLKVNMADASRENKLESEKICFVDCHAHISAKEFSEVRHVAVAKRGASLVHVDKRWRTRYVLVFWSLFKLLYSVYCCDKELWKRRFCFHLLKDVDVVIEAARKVS